MFILDWLHFGYTFFCNNAAPSARGNRWPYTVVCSKARSSASRDIFGKMRELTSRLIQASQAVDQVLTEMADAHRIQEVLLTQRTERMETLSRTEKELQERIDSLKELPLPAAEYFAELSRKTQEEQEKRRTFRDYKLIIISAVLSAALTATIMVFFG